MTTEITKDSGSHNAHAPHAPSGAHCWANCTGAKALCEANAHRVLKNDGSAYSNEGTEAHDWATWLLEGSITEKCIPETFHTHVVKYVDHCKSKSPAGVKYLVEVQAPLFYDPEHSGTCDFATICNETGVIIEDLKYGQGVLVEAYRNEQLAIYAMSLIRMMEDLYDFDDTTTVSMGIFQPRHREAMVSEPWVITMKELTEFCDHLEEKFSDSDRAVKAVRREFELDEGMDYTTADVLKAAPWVEFKPGLGDQGACRWCDARYFCDAKEALASTALEAPDSGVSGREMLASMPDLSKEENKLPVEERLRVRLARSGVTAPVTDEYLVQVYAAKKWITSFLKDAEEYLEARAHEGRAATGTKLVLGREGNRRWADEGAADTFLTGQKIKAEERYTRKLIGPAVAEKLIGDKTRTVNRFNELVTRSAPGKVLALDSDKRVAVAAAIEVMPDLGDEDSSENTSVSDQTQ